MNATFASAVGVLCCSVVLVTISPRQAFAIADISDWVAIDTELGANDYGLTSATSAGGTFADRKMNPASLSDHTVVGGPFHWDSQLSMSGTVTFSNAFDPVMFIGWYNSNNLVQRVGIGLANPVPAGSGIRWQTQSGNVAATTVNSQNFTGSTTTSTFAPGTYDFTFDYDGFGHMTGTFGGLEFARNYALPDETLLNMDRFGILQKSGADDDINTYTFSIQDITYTGQTDFVGGNLVGDHNDDGSVDTADYVVWRATDGSPTGYSDWVSNFGDASAGSASAQATPEPSSILLAILVGLAAAGGRLRRA